MNFKVIFIGLTLIISMVFGFPKGVEKKIKKEILSTFNVENYELIPISITSEVNENLEKPIKDSTLFKILSNDALIGYAFVDKAPSKTAQFDYLVLFNEELIIAKTKVLIYREEYGGEIGSKRWLRQFNGKSSSSDDLKAGNNIIAISGATISVNSMTKAVNQLLKNIGKLQEQNVF